MRGVVIVRNIFLIIGIIVIIIIAAIIYILVNYNNSKKVIGNSDNIQETNSNYIPQFTLTYTRNQDLNVNTIIANGEIKNCDYSIYSFGGDIDITINGETMSLKDALLGNKISMDDIINQCVKDANDNKIKTSMYKDGGSMIYEYSDYWIIKCNTIAGNNDVYIGMPNMSLTGSTNGDPVRLITY